MTATALDTHLGAATEALLARAFADTALITARAAAKILGLDEKTLAALVEAKAIRVVLVSERTRRFAEVDLRAYLARRTEITRCQSTSRPSRATSITTSSSKVVGFMEARAKRRIAAQSKSNRRNA